MKKISKTPPLVQKLFKEAIRARLKAYAPYSKFKVGAAFSSKGRIFTGCNVENASFGGTICAERTAIVKGISDHSLKIDDIVVVTDLKEPLAPCGLCRQVIAEFSTAKTRVWIANTKEIVGTILFDELFPRSMGALGKWFKG